MKTADEWNWQHTCDCANDPSVHGQMLSNPKMIKFIEEVQQDARAELVERIAELESLIADPGKAERYRLASRGIHVQSPESLRGTNDFPKIMDNQK